MSFNTTRFRFLASVATLLLLLFGAGRGVHAVLERTGPVSNAPSVGGYPTWYQDSTGLALEFCDPKNQAEVDGGWCLLLPGDPPAVPEVFPAQFFDEHFWFAADAGLTPATGGRALLVLAVEAAFVANVVPGGQITFSRIRVRLDPVPATGTYRFIHPYGEELIAAAQGDRIFFTDDVGINCAPGEFDCARGSRLGPFLLPSNTPGGAELAAVVGPVPGKLYIADPARSGPVTGSALPNFVDSTGASRNHNIFRIEGPAGSNLGGPGINFIETSDFSLMGRIFTGIMPGRVDVTRASYIRNATGRKLDVFATGSPTVQGRLPGQARPAAILPLLTFFEAPCAGTVDALTGDILPPFSAPVGALERQMYSTGSRFWGQSQPATVPTAVCVKDAAARDANGNIVPAYLQKRVTDEVAITTASWDPSTQKMTVRATSSDLVNQPRLSVAYEGYSGELVNGFVEVPSVAVPPYDVTVRSSAGGEDESVVTTGLSTGPPAGSPVAVNDSATYPEDSGPQTIAVLANDANVAGGTVSLTSLPRLGTAVVNADGTVTYTPNPNANGLDGFTYVVTVGTTASGPAGVSVTINPANDLPAAVNDTFAALANQTIALAVLANDTDPDGQADIVAIANQTQPLPGGATATVAGNVVNFNASLPGTYTFTYSAQDAGGALSNFATVTVNVGAAESIAISLAEYRRSQSRFRMTGTISPVTSPPQTLQIRWANGTNTTSVVATPVADALGNWAVDIRGAIGTQNPDSSGATQVVVTAPGGGRAVANITFR
ncbi:MAG: cadherin-like domain-containing protein [Chloroflexi bacterium]|nr:cadherin-like domain-containing protein [Chloroflexota bacterium]